MRFSILAKIEMCSLSTYIKKKRIMKISQIEHEMSTFSFPGRNMNLLQKKTLNLPGTSGFLPAGDMGGEINHLLIDRF